MFLGTHAPRLDEKGRIFMPAKFRDELASGLVITKGQERCLFVFTASEFARIAAGVREDSPIADSTSRDAPGGRVLRASNRFFFASASDESMDKQGRVTIPGALRAYAGLERECTVIGANSRIEVWDTAAWQDYLQEFESGSADGGDAAPPDVI